MKTLDAINDPFSFLPPRPRPVARLGTSLLVVLGLALAVLAATVLGAVLVHTTAPDLAIHTSPGFPRILAIAVALVVVLGVPLTLDAFLLRGHRRTHPYTRPVFGPVFATWNLLLVVVLLVAAPAVTRSSLESDGDWLVRGTEGVVPRVVRGGTHWVAARLPGSPPVSAWGGGPQADTHENGN